MSKFLLLMITLFSLKFYAQENLLDTSYGTNNGFTNFTIYNGAQLTGGLHIQSTAKMPDGKILAVGVRLIARFTANGKLDTTFNGTGYKFFASGNFGNLHLTNDGNYIFMDGEHNEIRKIDGDGNPVSGFTTFNKTGSHYIDPSGKIYLLKDNSGTYSIIRLLSNGIQDTTFTEIPLGSTYKYGTIKVNSNNEIFVAGRQEISANNRKIVVTKIAASGTIDLSFGNGGHFLYPGGEYVGGVNHLEFLDDGKILGLTSGALCYGDNCFGLIMYRLLPNGTLDTTFKNGGIYVLPIQSNSTPIEMIRHQDGSYIVSGTGMGTFYAIKMDSDGNLDPAFGTNGKIITPQLAGPGYPVYNLGFELYGNSIVFAGIYSIFSGGQLKYVGTLRKYFFNASTLNTSEADHSTALKVYPNPVKDYLHFQTKETFDRFEIHDQNGRKVISSKSMLPKNTIDVRSLVPGIYILNGFSNKGLLSSSKFIKQ
ncbi:T9SS type A sorting domain-containing protein [Chryseobacterium sp. G0186]|uniref:T9SS type A sorting domain-containing protein n=1 Tax=Chryseobacterium sp. G0186 TaxID=2487064 RepID=UPI0013DDE5C3|nr:T9SS type A sorting domain-containing protein [Chryseobacterium sp. G0186]